LPPPWERIPVSKPVVVFFRFYWCPFQPNLQRRERCLSQAEGDVPPPPLSCSPHTPALHPRALARWCQPRLPGSCFNPSPMICWMIWDVRLIEKVGCIWVYLCFRAAAITKFCRASGRRALSCPQAEQVPGTFFHVLAWCASSSFCDEHSSQVEVRVFHWTALGATRGCCFLNSSESLKRRLPVKNRAVAASLLPRPCWPHQSAYICAPPPHTHTHLLFIG
jgi:hypothetical protein